MTQGQKRPNETLFWRSSLPGKRKQLCHHQSLARWLTEAGEVLLGSRDGQSHLLVGILDGFLEEVAFELGTNG